MSRASAVRDVTDSPSTVLHVVPGAVCLDVDASTGLLQVSVRGQVRSAGWDRQLVPRTGSVLLVEALGQLTVLAFLSPII